MKIYKILSVSAILVTLIGSSSCKKQLNVNNPNQPTLAQATTEPGIIALALGAVYVDGFNGAPTGSLNTLGNSYFSNALDYQEELADDVNSPDANRNLNVINLPDYVILDNGTKITNASPHKTNTRVNNTRATRASNAFYYEWAYMYALNGACNTVLSIAPNVTFGGAAGARLATIQAWCYWWKGVAYSKIGSLYYAGLINNTANSINANYVNSAAMIAESNRYFELAKATITGITSTADFTTVLTQLIPAFTVAGNGGILTPTMWVHSINTMEARNLLANKLVSAMTAADWATISTLTANGIQSTDYVFTGRTVASNSFFSLTTGTTPANTAGVGGSNSGTTFEISERFIQEYKAGDKRFTENFVPYNYYNSVGGFISSTRWGLVTGGTGVALPAGANAPSFILADIKTYGNYQIWIAGSYEENELMKAEALINTNQIDLGLASVDKIRVYQGAGLAAVSGTGLTLAQAKEELRRERRVALVFRGVSFYDARRQGFLYDITKGGGRTGCVVWTNTGVLNVNATINYDFWDYWDVPADESVINPPAAGSAPILNPN